MALSDAQIERFSRQIILPQIGAAGQQRLLRSSIAVAGDGPLAEIAALYLAGAGVGSIALHGADREPLRAQLLDLDPDVRVSLPAGALGGVDADVLVACDAALAEIDRAAAARRPIVAGGSDGWMVVADRAEICTSCAARSRAPSPRMEEGAGVIGALISLAVLKLLVGIGDPPRRVWLQFDPVRSTLTEHPLEPISDCPRCAA
jgi:molybdopterin/thiamine biosynthesis adenylyltransferase